MEQDEIFFKGEFIFSGWREGSKSPPIVSFITDDIEPFKGIKTGKKEGKRFMCVLVEIGDDEMPVVQDVPDVGNAYVIGEECEGEEPKDEEAGKAFDEMFDGEHMGFVKSRKPSQEAHLVVIHINFGKFLRDEHPNNYFGCGDDPDETLKSILGIESKSELDIHEAKANKFMRLMKDYHSYCVEGGLV